MKLFKAFIFTSLPMALFFYFYGAHAVLVWYGAFVCGVIFREPFLGRISFKEYLNSIIKYFKIEVRYWKCRLHRHKLTDHWMGPVFDTSAHYKFCEQCDSFIKVNCK